MLRQSPTSARSTTPMVRGARTTPGTSRSAPWTRGRRWSDASASRSCHRSNGARSRPKSPWTRRCVRSVWAHRA